MNYFTAARGGKTDDAVTKLGAHPSKDKREYRINITWQVMMNMRQNLAESILETVRESLVLLTADLRVELANRSFYETFVATPEQTIGCHFYDLGNGQWDIPKLRLLLEEILPMHAELHDFEVEHDFPTIGPKVMRLNARHLIQSEGGGAFILLAIEDITEKRALERGVAWVWWTPKRLSYHAQPERCSHAKESSPIS
jgi:PAS domain-containing protein